MDAKAERRLSACRICKRIHVKETKVKPPLGKSQLVRREIEVAGQKGHSLSRFALD